MKPIFETDWPFIFILLLLSIFHFWGVQFIPFHPDESTQLYMSNDFKLLFTNPSSMFWQLEKENDACQRYRELDAPITKYLLGLGQVITGQAPLGVDWNWNKSWDENVLAGAYPNTKLIHIGRMSITALLPITLTFIYLIGKQLRGRITGLIAILFFGTHAIVLLHGRRAMAEGALMMGIAFTAWAILNAAKQPWLVGLGFAVAFNAKQSALALIPVIFLSLFWVKGNKSTIIKTIARNILMFLITFVIVTLALNPLYWSNPYKAFQSSINARKSLLESQVKDIQEIAPEKYLDNPGKRFLVLVFNLYITPPSSTLVANLEPTREAVEAYNAITGHNLFRGTIWGAIFLVLTIFGIILALCYYPAGKQQVIILFLLATFFMAAGLLIAVSLPWARFSTPLIPFTSLWLAYGLTAFNKLPQILPKYPLHRRMS